MINLLQDKVNHRATLISPVCLKSSFPHFPINIPIACLFVQHPAWLSSMPGCEMLREDSGWFWRAAEVFLFFPPPEWETNKSLFNKSVYCKCIRTKTSSNTSHTWTELQTWQNNNQSEYTYYDNSTMLDCNNTLQYLIKHSNFFRFPFICWLLFH